MLSDGCRGDSAAQSHGIPCGTVGVDIVGDMAYDVVDFFREECGRLYESEPAVTLGDVGYACVDFLGPDAALKCTGNP